MPPDAWHQEWTGPPRDAVNLCAKVLSAEPEEPAIAAGVVAGARPTACQDDHAGNVSSVLCEQNNNMQRYATADIVAMAEPLTAAVS